MKLSGVTLVLFCLAGACYATAWTAAGTSLVVFGVLFELCAWLSLLPTPVSKKPKARAQQEGEKTNHA